MANFYLCLVLLALSNLTWCTSQKAESKARIFIDNLPKMKLASMRDCPNVRFPFLRSRTGDTCPVPIIPFPQEDRPVPVVPVESRAKAVFLRAVERIKAKLNPKNPAEDQAPSSQIVKSSLENIASKFKIPMANRPRPSKLRIPVEKRSPKSSNPPAQSPNVPENRNKFQARAQLSHIGRTPLTLIKTENMPQPRSGRTRLSVNF